MISFPECINVLLADCIATINTQLGSIGLQTVEVVIHEKRNPDQDGYNKVVIVTNELADLVVGQQGDGIVEYPFLWDDKISGVRALGVDGKWNCHGFTPERCCSDIKDSAYMFVFPVCLLSLNLSSYSHTHTLPPKQIILFSYSGTPNPDTRDNNLECHIFVPYGGVGNPRRNDRVFINLSPDGRVHEPPVVQ